MQNQLLTAGPNPNGYLSDNYVVLDFETDTADGGYGNPINPVNGLLLACWKTPDGEMHSKWGGELEMAELLAAILDADFLVCHQAKYELGWLRRCGLNLRDVVVFDTKIAEYVLSGNIQLNTSLNTAAQRRGDKPKDPVVETYMQNGINPISVPRAWLEGRCKQDVLSTEKVFLDQRQRLLESGRLPVQYTRCLLTPVLADVAPEGMQLDADKVEAEYAKVLAELEVARADMDAITGGINWRSAPQIAEIIYDKLGFPEKLRRDGTPIRNPGGGRLTGQKHLETLRAVTPDQERFLTVRKRVGVLQARLTKALEPFIGAVREKGGIIYADLNQTVTATHRLSSTGIPVQYTLFKKPKSVQFQNFPRTLKHLFRAKRPGWKIVEPDGSQLEFRTAGMLSGDPQIKADLENRDHDAHLFTASVLHKCSLDDVRAEKKRAEADGRDDWRQLAKPDTFKPLYGGEKGTPDQERYYEAFRRRYATLTAVQNNWAAQVRLSKVLITPWGLRYYWPHAKIDNRGRLDCRRQVFNYPIQALATAEIVPIAMVYLWHRVAAAGIADKVAFINTIHDSVVMEVHPDYTEQVVELCLQAFTHDVFKYMKEVYKFETDIPLGMGIKVGDWWSKGEERSYNVWADGRQERIK